MKSLLIRIILILTVGEIAYLALVNLALNLPLTQSLVNQHRPEKYAVYWERAWSWYPFRVHVRGLSVNGQTRSQQWQADTPVASASVAVLPLFRRTVQVDDVAAEDLAFRLRPRPKPDKDYAATRGFFPPIRDRDPDSPAASRKPRKPGTGWRIVVDGARARGHHEFWVFQVRGAADGDLRATLTYQTRGGPVSVSGGEADLALRHLTVNKDWEVSSGGAVKGVFELAPFVPAENPGLKALGFLTVDAELDAAVESLGFLDFYLRRVNGMAMDGKGQLRGHLHYEQGNLVHGTDLKVSADRLALSVPPYQVAGSGGIAIRMSPDQPETLGIDILFDALEALHRGDQVPLFTGQGLRVVAQGTARVLPDAARERGQGRLALSIPSVQVPDLRVYQRYLPDRWNLELKGGQGSLQGQAQFSASDLSAQLNLVSDDAHLRFKDFRFETNLDLGLKVTGDASGSANVDLSGTYLRLDQARLASTKQGGSKPWQASFAIAQGTLGIPLPEGKAQASGFRHLSQVFKAQGMKQLLASADAKLEADLSVSDLGWVNLLFKNDFDLAVAGSGRAAVDLRIHNGWLARGAKLRVRPRGLEVQVLDYVAQGQGVVALAVVQGGKQPDMRLDAQLEEAWLKRRGEADAVVEQVTLELSALARDVALGGGGRVAALDLRIPSARLTDMSVYNQYLPKDAPLQLLEGKANLTADIHLEPEAAGGFVKLATDRLRSRLDEQEVAGVLTLDIELRDGVPSDMAFDISGSSLALDGFQVSGEEKSFHQPDWRARFDLRKAQVVWRKPIRLDVEADITMKDSRPIVALFANQRGKHGWLEKILTVEHVNGTASLEVASERALVPYALVGSDKIDVGAKGLVAAGTREAIFYARFRKLHGILKVKDGQRNFDLFGARKKFDAYTPGDMPLSLRGPVQAESTEAALDSGQATSEVFVVE